MHFIAKAVQMIPITKGFPQIPIFERMSDLSRLGGVGPKREKLLEEAGIRTLRDLVYHLPRRYIDRTRFITISDLEVGKDCIFTVRVGSISFPPNRMIVEVEDATGHVDLVFFNGIKFLRGRFHEGQHLVVAGTPTYFRDLQMVHPEWEAIEEGQELKGAILPRYPLTEGMAEAHIEHKFLQKAALEALEKFSFSDSIEAGHRGELGLLPETELLRLLHRPVKVEEIPSLRRQLKIRELLPLSLRLEAVKRERSKAGRAWAPAKTLREKLLAALPFQLTKGQEQSVAEITKLQAAPGQFCGLLQGDVGSGKTVVALLAAANVIEAGGQAALMAPTEILAIQHHQTVSPWLKAAGLRCALLTGDTPDSERKDLVAALAGGELPFVVGTHALFSGDVRFRNLGLAIIDEQHRFGVNQRQALAEKGRNPDLLYMSATPIPRTLAQTVFGDLENFELREKPAGRLPVKTRLVPPNKRKDMMGFLLKEVAEGNQVFWVVPQIGRTERTAKQKEEDPDIFIPAGRPEEDIATLERVSKELAAFSRDWKIDVVHGRLPAEKKEAVLKAFRQGVTRVLLATTVIEVGVDVPQANLMVIESPDRFGLAQLHQLRGRTGRGSAQAWCFLAQPEREWPVETFDRLAGFAETADGFAIAEMDLKMRGTGSLEGTAQSGYGGLRFTDLIEDFALTQEVRRYAEGKIGAP
jgi:ATP-dependent DNA helicase RecG